MQKCTLVGVTNVAIPRGVAARGPASATTAMTTNIRPVSAAADVPTMT